VYGYFAGLVKMVGREHLGRQLNQAGTVVFEGAQGVLLDEWYGFYPYNSWSTLTFKNAENLLTENDYKGDALRLGLLRGYATRHGAGPFVSEDAQLTQQVQDYHNTNNPWQRQFRVGYLDFVALRYALQVCGKVDGLVVTNLDRMAGLADWRTCSAYQMPANQPDGADYFQLDQRLITAIKMPADPTDLVKQERLTRLLMQARPVYSSCEKEQGAYLEAISAALKLPVAITSNGPGAADKEYFFSLAGSTKHALREAASLKSV
jgi:adenylosuccinate synthase